MCHLGKESKLMKLNIHLFPPPFELKLNKTNAKRPINKGIEMTVNGILLKSPSNLSANNT